MIKVKTHLGASKKHGIGLFADQDIPKGTVTWVYHPKFDTAFSQEDVDAMSEAAKQQFLHYAYWDHERQHYVLCYDDQRFINHCSKDTNIESTPDRDVAMRDIKKGEELLCDYKGFEHTFFERKGIDETDLI
ncbi:MAG: SET domain-containing protein [bacterium]|nr:SET domain-containing protein [bacterium]